LNSVNDSLYKQPKAVNCIVTERCRWQEERGQDGAAVDRKTTLQGSFSSGTARDGVVGSSPTGGAKIKTYHNRGRFLFCVFIPSLFCFKH
jgi:hypothetical protein